jgi:hypothetical protein
MSADSQIVVRSALDLWQALRWRGDVALRLPSMDARLQARAEKRFNFWRTVCGCQVGALLLLGALGFRIPAMLRTPEWTWAALATEGGIALSAALAGKVFSMAGARLLLAVDVALFLRRARRMFPNAVGS